MEDAVGKLGENTISSIRVADLLRMHGEGKCRPLAATAFINESLERPKLTAAFRKCLKTSAPPLPISMTMTRRSTSFPTPQLSGSCLCYGLTTVLSRLPSSKVQKFREDEKDTEVQTPASFSPSLGFAKARRLLST